MYILPRHLSNVLRFCYKLKMFNIYFLSRDFYEFPHELSCSNNIYIFYIKVYEFFGNWLVLILYFYYVYFLYFMFIFLIYLYMHGNIYKNLSKFTLFYYYFLFVPYRNNFDYVIFISLLMILIFMIYTTSS